jgi:hypothetical protein
MPTTTTNPTTVTAASSERPATTTKLTGLTPHNTTALTGVEGWMVTKTTATYAGSPTAALDAVQQRMDKVRATEGGRATGYASLIAVRNKLRECSTGASHPAVTVTVKRAKKATAPKTRTGSPTARLTRKRQTEYTTAELVAALETAWSAKDSNDPSKRSSPPCCTKQPTPWPTPVASKTPAGRAGGTTRSSPGDDYALVVLINPASSPEPYRVVGRYCIGCGYQMFGTPELEPARAPVF